MSAVISTITIDSLLNCLVESEIIVIDNASTDGSLDALVGLPCAQIIKKVQPTLVSLRLVISGARVVSVQLLLFLIRTGSSSLVRWSDCWTQCVWVSVWGCTHPLAFFVYVFELVSFSDRWPRLFFDFHLHKRPLPDHSIEVKAISRAFIMVRCEAMQDVGEQINSLFSLVRPAWALTRRWKSSGNPREPQGGGREADAEGSGEQTCEPTNRNRIRGAADQGERANDREALPTKGQAA